MAAGSANFAAIPGASGSGGAAIVDPNAPDVPGTFASYTSAPLPKTTDVVGIPKLRVRLSAPTFAQTQGANPAGKLILFAKLLDVDADGGTTLPRNQLSAVRVADVTKPVEIELPGIAHRFAKGHRFRVVVATANATNKGNTLAGPVSIATDSANPGTLTLPRVGSSVSTLPGRCLSQALADRPAQHRPHPPRLHPRTAAAPRARTARAAHGPHVPLLRDRPQRSRDRRLLEPLAPRARAAGDHHRPRPRQPARARGLHRRPVPARLLAPPPRGPGIFRASPRSPRLFGVRRGKVSFIAVTHSTRGLRRQLRLAGVRPR